jgi:hypothetical protein
MKQLSGWLIFWIIVLISSFGNFIYQFNDWTVIQKEMKKVGLTDSEKVKEYLNGLPDQCKVAVGYTAQALLLMHAFMSLIFVGIIVFIMYKNA